MYCLRSFWPLARWRSLVRYRAGTSMTLVDIGRRAQGGRIGDSPTRPDGQAKVDGTFRFASDLPMDGAAWGATLRSPHPYARLVAINIAPALAIPGVHVVLTAADVPGRPRHCGDLHPTVGRRIVNVHFRLWASFFVGEMLPADRVNLSVQRDAAQMISGIGHWREQLAIECRRPPCGATIEIESPMGPVVLYQDTVCTNCAPEEVKFTSQLDKCTSSPLVRQGRSRRPDVVVNTILPNLLRTRPRMISKKATGKPERLIGG